MRKINLLVIHCSASDNPDQGTVDAIRHLHTGNKKTKIQWGKYNTTCKGWSDIGYHYIITRDGDIHTGRPVHKQGAHARGFNKSSIGICLVGELDFTPEQFKSLKTVTDELILNFGLSRIDIIGHKDLDKGKLCPGFDVHEVLRGDNGH